MGKNISVYASDTTLANIDLIMEKWHQQDIEDNWHPEIKTSRSDIIAVAISYLFEKEFLDK